MFYNVFKHFKKDVISYEIRTDVIYLYVLKCTCQKMIYTHEYTKVFLMKYRKTFLIESISDYDGAVIELKNKGQYKV